MEFACTLPPITLYGRMQFFTSIWDKDQPQFTATERKTLTIFILATKAKVSL